MTESNLSRSHFLLLTYLHAYIHMYKCTHMRWAYGTYVYVYISIHRPTHTPTYIRTYELRTYARTYRQTDRQTNRQTGRHNYTHAFACIHRYVHTYTQICNYMHYAYILRQRKPQTVKDQARSTPRRSRDRHTRPAGLSGPPGTPHRPRPP